MEIHTERVGKREWNENNNNLNDNSSGGNDGGGDNNSIEHLIITMVRDHYGRNGYDVFILQWIFQCATKRFSIHALE